MELIFAVLWAGASIEGFQYEHVTIHILEFMDCIAKSALSVGGKVQMHGRTSVFSHLWHPYALRANNYM